MAVFINEAALRLLLHSEDGPVGQEIRRRAQEVEEIARTNIQGPWLEVDTGDLLGNLVATPIDTPDGVGYMVGSNAEHRGFRYGGFWDQNGRPWLTEALADVFA